MQPIAGQLIELAKKNSSSDNISVIVVFLKDPHQIIAEHKLVSDTEEVIKMDFESTNGCHLVDDGLLASNPSSMHDDTEPTSDKMHVDFNKATVDVHHDAMDVNDFYFGKNGSGIGSDSVDDVNEYHSNIQTISSTITSNGDADKFSSNEINVGRSIDDDHDDFGPETDVDATDDNAISPMSPGVSFMNFNFVSHKNFRFVFLFECAKLRGGNFIYRMVFFPSPFQSVWMECKQIYERM